MTKEERYELAVRRVADATEEIAEIMRDDDIYHNLWKVKELLKLRTELDNVVTAMSQSRSILT
jgi:hypothetical protein